MAGDGIDTNSDDGRLQYLTKAAEIIASEKDVVTRDIYIGRLCDKYGVSRNALTAKVTELQRKKNRSKERKEIEEIIRPKLNKNDINPDRRFSIKGTAAEETLLAVLLQHPDFYTEAKEKLPPDKMVTGLNRRIYETLLNALDGGRSPDISIFAEKLIPAELGYLVSLQNSDKAGNNSKQVLKDCIKVILEERTIIDTGDSKESSVEDWAANLKNIIEKK